MTRANTEIKVRSHVGRDLLASAASFKTEAAVIWEYVVNSLQYVERGVTPRVDVRLDAGRRRIVVSDNGRGMDAAGLHNFFTMHGENVDRLAGRPGRGKFGTGKAAAFGIANRLTIDTVREGRRNVVTLDRQMITSSGGKEIPVRWLTREQATTDKNGTTVTIDELVINRVRTTPVIEYIERHMTAFRGISPEVAVNNHVCAAREPEIESEQVFHPTPSQAAVLGPVTLTVKVARAPLPEQEQGIAVTAGAGNLVAIETAGVESKEFGSYLFGEIDVTALETYDTPIEPYDSSRSLELNPQHPVVAVLVPFVGSKLEMVRGELVKRAKEERKNEQSRRLASEAQRIADILNDDFRMVRQRLQEIRAASLRPGDAGNAGGSVQSGVVPEAWVEGTQAPGDTAHRSLPNEGQGTRGRTPPEIAKPSQPNPSGLTAVDPIGGEGQKHRPRGGFTVVYRSLGQNEDRSRYDSPTLTILINLDHAVVRAALDEGNVEDPVFRRLSYEIAFSEYAMGLGYEVFKQDPNIPADDLLYEVRSTLNRVAAAAASLYKAQAQ